MAIEYMRFESVQNRSARLSDYISRMGEYKSKENDFVCGGVAGLPSWAKDGHDFFLQAENREQGEIGKHVIIALPKEFNKEENEKLSKEVLETIFPTHTYVWGIHENNGVLSGEKNPHLHVLVCDRKIEKERDEPPIEIYFKKSRTLKTGEISGGYRKDPLISGSERQKGLLLKKMALQEIMNRHIDRHNEKTGENVSKIDFRERHGKGQRHIGKKAISMALKENGNVVQSEVNRRITVESEKEAAIVLNQRKENTQKTTKLTISDRVGLSVKSFIQNPLNATERAKNKEITEMAIRRGKLTNKQKISLAEADIENIAEAAERNNERIEKTRQNLQREAEKRGIMRKVTLEKSEKAEESLFSLARNAAAEREAAEKAIAETEAKARIAREKREADERRKNAEKLRQIEKEREEATKHMLKEFTEIDLEQQRKLLEWKKAREEEARQHAEEVTRKIQQCRQKEVKTVEVTEKTHKQAEKPSPVKALERQEPRKTIVKAKKTERDKGYSR